MSASMCPATMCPLFAAEGSPWTGEVNAPCEQGPACAFWNRGHCDGAAAAHHQVGEMANGDRPLQIGPKRATRTTAIRHREYDCPRAAECQWQIEADAEGGLCPPRSALALGLDPKTCAW